MTATSLSLFCLNARKYMKPTWNYSKENFENKVNAASLGCFLLAPDANLSWTDAQLFCERVYFISYPILPQLYRFYPLKLSPQQYEIYVTMCVILWPRPGAIWQSFAHHSRLQTIIQNFQPCFIWRCCFNFPLQASLVSSLAHLLSSASSIKHW